MSGQPPPPYGPPPPRYGQPPYGQPPYGGGPGWGPGTPMRETVPGAVLALVLGIVGIVFCPIAAPFAWFIGRGAEQTIATDPNRYSGKEMATAGKIVGIIGSILLTLYVIAIVVVVIVAIATSGGGGTS